MRKNCLRTLGLLAVLAVTAGLATPRRAQSIPPPSCTLAYQECLSCGIGLQTLCSVYDCDDGSERTFCGNSCTYYCVVP